MSCAEEEEEEEEEEEQEEQEEEKERAPGGRLLKTRTQHWSDVGK